jgi:hypothetical protein
MSRIMTMNELTALMGLLGLTSLACNARTAIGQVSDAAAAQTLSPVGTSGHTCTPPPFSDDPPFTFPAGVEGVWTGFVDGGTPGIASDAIRLTLDHAADGTSQIHVAYGTAPPPAPVTSATALPPGYPLFGLPYSPFEGFPYLAHNVDWQPFGQQWRLRFLTVTTEPVGPWCRLQSSYLVKQGTDQAHYTCTPNVNGYHGSVGGNPGTGSCFLVDSSGQQNQAISCAQIAICEVDKDCACDECGCDDASTRYDSGPWSRTFDLLLDGNTATGGGIHLARAAN